METEVIDIDGTENADYHSLNAEVNLLNEDGELQLEKDQEALREYFLTNVNPNTVFFHTLQEKLDYLVENGYYEGELLDEYSPEFIKELFQRAYGYKFRFKSFLGAFKYYTQYTLKTFDGKRYLERYEDRVVMNALYLGDGDEEFAKNVLDEMMTGRYQPATPTFLNAGKKQRGELISCYLLRTEDNMESIGRVINSSLQLSKRGGGVGINLTNLRETGAPIKKIENQASGIVPVMKILEDSFSYANQLGARQGAGAVYLNVHHPDVLLALDTKRENADEKIRIKTLSLGLVIPDITFELAKRNEEMFLFSPYDVEREYGKAFSDISVTEEYYNMVNNPNIRKKSISARKLFSTIAEIQFESGYPYIMYEDTVNRANNIDGRISMSNLCVTGDTEILTDKGYKNVRELFDTQEDFDVVVDRRARDMNLEKNGVSLEKSTKMFKTEQDAEITKLETKEGFSLRATPWHKMYVKREDDLVKIPLKEVVVGDKILVQSAEGQFGGESNVDLAYLAGAIAADGTIWETVSSAGNHLYSAKLYLYDKKRELAEKIEESMAKVLKGREDLLQRQSTLTPKYVRSDPERWNVSSAPLAKVFQEVGFDQESKLTVPEFVKKGDRETQLAYLSGLFTFDGCITGDGPSIQITSINRELLEGVQRLLINLGVFGRIYKASEEMADTLPGPDGEPTEYTRKPSWRLYINGKRDGQRLYDLLEWGSWQEEAMKDIVSEYRSDKIYNTHNFLATVSSLKADGVEDVYDVTVENGNSVIFNGIATGQCSEIFQVSTPSEYNPDGSYKHVGRDISCNLGSLNVFNAFNSPDFEKTVETAVRALTTVSDFSNIETVPSVQNGNEKSRAIGLGQMNLHGFFAVNEIFYDSPEALDFTNVYFYTVLYNAIKASNKLAKETGESFYEFEKSKYASGEFFDKYIEKDWGEIKTDKVREIFEESDLKIPTVEDWKELKKEVMEHGMHNAYLLAIPPTGSISYLSSATSSIHPVTSPIEKRKEGFVGRVYYPAFGLTNDNIHYYKDAFALGPEPIIDLYAAATEHTDQGLSLTLFFPDTATTRDLNRAYIYAFTKGIKSIYYIRVKQKALDGTEIEDATTYCESCML